MFDKRNLTERLAYRLWELDGRPEGKALEYWIRAEKIVSQPPPVNQIFYYPPNLVGST